MHWRAIIPFLRDLIAFLRHRKKLWMLPMILVFAAVGGMLVLAKGSILSPFIYTLF
ncbi:MULTISPECIES: DUF5989 family protein [unclassified Sphingomonas]|uniref:DUF5989 family protein n=1 Tax=unclassified Sphingomonas TaxID=196159 RepID=UPI000AA88B81|nr:MULTISPECIES: DUF5989 family protein [unclassified Sphingomonas]